MSFLPTDNWNPLYLMLSTFLWKSNVITIYFLLGFQLSSKRVAVWYYFVLLEFDCWHRFHARYCSRTVSVTWLASLKLANFRSFWKACTVWNQSFGISYYFFYSAISRLVMTQMHIFTFPWFWGKYYFFLSGKLFLIRKWQRKRPKGGDGTGKNRKK